jgi:hypothetical protein
MTGDFAVALALGVVLVILVAGIFVMIKGGQTSKNWSNRLMRYRVLAQFIAVIVIMTVLYLSGG